MIIEEACISSSRSHTFFNKTVEWEERRIRSIDHGRIFVIAELLENLMSEVYNNVTKLNKSGIIGLDIWNGLQSKYLNNQNSCIFKVLNASI